MWNKYLCANKQTACMLGVLILSAKLCKNDGHYSKKEEQEILSAMPHEIKDEKLLIQILDDAGNDAQPIEYDAKVIKDKMGENKELLEFIIATLYKLAKSDNIFSEQEEKDIQKIALIFGIKQTLFEKFVNRFPILKSTYAGFNKNI